jgi:hypothetical protein
MYTWRDLYQWAYQSRIFLITLGFVSLAYNFGYDVPLTFLKLDDASVAVFHRGSWSVFALHMQPWLLALFLAEGLAIALAVFGRKKMIEHANPLGWAVLMLALTIAFFESFQFLDVLAVAGHMLTIPEWAPLITISISMLAGFSILLYLAVIIDRFVSGLGLWVLLTVASLSNFPRELHTTIETFDQNITSPKYIIVWLLVIILTICASAFVTELHHRRDKRNVLNLIFGAFLALDVSSYLFQTLRFYSSSISQWTETSSAHFVTIEISLDIICFTGFAFLLFGKQSRYLLTLSAIAFWTLIDAANTACLYLVVPSYFFYQTHLVVLAYGAIRWREAMDSIRLTRLTKQAFA